MSMRGMGGPMRGGFMDEEEKSKAPKITKELILRVLSYLKPYTTQMVLVLLAIILSSIFTGKELYIYPSSFSLSS